MSQNTDFNLPFNNLVSYVPKALKNSMNSSLLDTLFNRFMSHDESIPVYGYIGKKPSNVNDKSPRVPQPTVERDLNAIIPVITFNVGAEKKIFTFQDLMNRAKTMGISDNLDWLYSQGNNFVPPIDIDKFTNFFNYYWLTDGKPGPSWNPTNQPEYYTIARPKLDDKIKLNVDVATVGPIALTGTGFSNQQFIVTFVTPTVLTITNTANTDVWPPLQSNFDISNDLNAVIEYKVANELGDVKTLLTFTVAREQIFNSEGQPIGISAFEANDQFIIDASFLSKNYTVKFIGGSGVKGKILGVHALSEYQTVDGYTIKEGDRVLVKNNVASENGIYIASARDWSRAADFTTVTGVSGSEVFVKNGVVNKNTLWTSSVVSNGNMFTQTDGYVQSNTNDWQETNRWVRIDELKARGLAKSAAIQAVRPIIEYSSTLELNDKVKDGKPSNVGANIGKFKTEFNQLPLFNLYHYDGTHAGKVSSIFFYEEDPSSALDVVLQKRAKKSNNDSGDFIFAHGCHDENNKLLFFKDNGKLSTVWKPGHIMPVVANISFAGSGNGSISFFTPAPNTQQQIWTIEATSSNTFKVSGSKTKTMPFTIIADRGFVCDDFSCTIVSGTKPFSVGDTFKVAVGNLERPRYVYKNEADEIEDLYGGKAKDADGIGAYQVTRTLINNPYNESTNEISEGSAYSHFRSILANQLDDKLDASFGGNIKLWSEQHTLLSSLLMQKDLTPASMITFAQQQYEQGLNAIKDIYEQNILTYLSSVGVPNTTEKLNALLDWILATRANDYDVKTVLADSTSPVVGFPPTLPMLGILPLTRPSIEYDKELARVLLTHHDGHKSPLFEDGFEFRQSVLGRYTDILIERSDGEKTPAVGSLSAEPPADPYKGELWITRTGETHTVFVFDVISDKVQPTTARAGDFWYDKIRKILYLRLDNGTWAPQPSVRAGWTKLDLAGILNALNLMVETRLHQGINEITRKYDFTSLQRDEKFNDILKQEFFTFAAQNGYDPLAPKFMPSDAFTWNYSSAQFINFSQLTSEAIAKMPARWNNLLIAHQLAVLRDIRRTTERPDIEPWVLLGYSSYEEWRNPAELPTGLTLSWTPAFEGFFSDKPNIVFLDGGLVTAVKTTEASTVLEGLPTVDGVVLKEGDLLLLVNENDPAKNGVWRVSAGLWMRGPQPLTVNLKVTVASGVQYAGTSWALTQHVQIYDSDPVYFKQVRRWSNKLWADIKQLFGQAFKTSVNSVTDELLPPYVSANDLQSANALTSIMPTGISNGYRFGDHGPVEAVWRKSIEFGYGLARALFKFDPLAFLGFCWGFNWVEVDGILYDGFDMQMPGHKRFKLHGEEITASPARQLSISRLTDVADQTLEITFDGYGQSMQGAGGSRQLFSIKENDKIISYAEEGITSNLFRRAGDISFLIEDNGVPFRIGDKFTIAIVNGTATTSFTPATRHNIQGFGQIFTHALRAVSIDSPDSYAVNAFRNWDINMGYRASGLVATDDLKLYTDSETLSDSAYSLLFKKNERAQAHWVQALRIQLTQASTFTTDPNGLIYPKSDASDWIFRIEGFNPRHLDISFYTMSNTDMVTFNALSKAHTDITWNKPTKTETLVKAQLPLTIQGVQNVIKFLFGYNAYLEEQGWEFNRHDKFNIDAETGRKRNWQLEVEKFVDACFGGVKLGQGHIINPFMDKIWFNHPRGLLSKFDNEVLFDISGHPGIYDVFGVRIKTDDIKVIRTNTISEISSDAPMYSAQIQIDEFEHIFIFNNYAQASTKSGLLYEPFTGARVITYKINGRRQANFSMRPEFGGHYLVGNEVRQNLQASTDNVANFYNANNVFENATTSRHALALLGFNNKRYFDDLDISNATQFNFWRGMVQSKGTYSSILAYLNNGRFDDAKIDEYWAYKVAEYGDARQRSFPEMRVSVQDTLQQFTKLQFDPQVGTWDRVSNPAGELPGFTYVSTADEKRWFSIDDMNQETYFNAEVVGTFEKTVMAGDIIKLPFVADKLEGIENFSKINSTTLRANIGGAVKIVGYGPATPRYNPVKLFNYVANELVEEIPVWNPAAGTHTPAALENVNVISKINPAKYNYSTQVTNNASLDPLRPWGAKEVGRVWLDTRNLEYVPYYDNTIFPQLDERLNRWGALAEYASVDVYEWVKSSVPPSEYNAKALEDAGNTDIDPSIRAAGIVADPQTYHRQRAWGVYPVAWSYSPLLIKEGHPAFNSSFESAINVDTSGNSVDGTKPSELKLFLDGGVVWLENGSFANFGITAGMRIGAWDPDPDYPKPLSEMIVKDAFFKKPFRNNGDIGDIAIEEQSTDGVPASVKISIAENSTVRGNIKFSAYPISPVQREDSELPVWDVPVRLIITEEGTGKTESILLNSGVGTEFDQPGVDPKPEIPYRPAVPAVPAQPSSLTLLIPGGITVNTGTGIEASTMEDGQAVVKNYATTISIDGVNYIINALGTEIQNWGQVMSVINSQIGREATTIEPVTYKNAAGATVTENQFVIKGLSTNPEISSVRIVVSGFFAQVSSIYKQLSQGATKETPEIPAQEAVPAQPGIPPFYTDAFHGAKLSVTEGQIFTFEAPIFKLTITLTAIEGGVFDIDAIQRAIVSTLGAEGNPVILKDAVEVDIVVPLPDDIRITQPNVLSNNTFDAEYEANAGIGWRAWSVPTQADLDNDGQQPNSAWKPYVGPLYNFVNGDATINFVQDAIAYVKDPLVLNDGTVVPRYETSWEDWTVVKDTKVSVTNAFGAVTSIPFTFEELIDPIRTSVYVNGIAQLRASYQIEGRKLTVLNVYPGSEVVVIIRKYEPRAEELAFNPDVQDNLLFQHQYKKDYEYVVSPVRNTDGSITSMEYYFWVKNKSSAAQGKKMSIQAVAQELASGPTSYLTFQNLLTETEELPNRYTAVTVAGLNFVVTKDNTFKLRFTRNFTLRDDPEDLNLKDYHTEWSLMRENQKAKVPVKLWNKLVDSAAGLDAVGNDVPSLRRVLYDERNGTRTQFGFNTEQTLAPADLLRSSILHTILNTKLIDTTGDIPVSDYIKVLNFNESDLWFSTALNTRKTLSDIWLNAKPSQINEIFFAALNDMLACNYEMTDIFKTSRLSAYSIKLVPIPAVAATYE